MTKLKANKTAITINELPPSPQRAQAAGSTSLCVISEFKGGPRTQSAHPEPAFRSLLCHKYWEARVMKCHRRLLLHNYPAAAAAGATFQLLLHLPTSEMCTTALSTAKVLPSFFSSYDRDCLLTFLQHLMLPQSVRFWDAPANFMHLTWKMLM